MAPCSLDASQFPALGVAASCPPPSAPGIWHAPRAAALPTRSTPAEQAHQPGPCTSTTPPPLRVRTVENAVYWSNPSLMQRLLGFGIVDCGGEGDCFFLCLQQLLYSHGRPPTTVTKLRTLVADYIRDASVEGSPVLTHLASELELIGFEDSRQRIRTLPAYAEHIRRKGVYASAVFEIPIVAQLLNLRVHLVLEEQGAAGAAIGAQMRDRCVMPPPGLHKDEPLEIHLLLLTKVCVHTSCFPVSSCGNACWCSQFFLFVSLPPRQSRHFQALMPTVDAQQRAQLQGKARAVFNLSVGMGSSEQRFGRQQQALLAFVADHAEELDEMSYAMQTVDPPCTKRNQLRAVDTVIRRSVIAPGILGVFPAAALPPLSGKSSSQQR